MQKIETLFPQHHILTTTNNNNNQTTTMNAKTMKKPRLVMTCAFCCAKKPATFCSPIKKMCKECFAIPTRELQLKYGIWVEDSNIDDLEEVLEKLQDDLEDDHFDTKCKTKEQYIADIDKLARAVEEQQDVDYIMFPIWTDIDDKGNAEFEKQIWLVQFEGDEVFTTFILTDIRNKWNYWRKNEYECGDTITWEQLRRMTNPDDHEILGLYMNLSNLDSAISRIEKEKRVYELDNIRLIWEIRDDHNCILEDFETEEEARGRCREMLTMLEPNATIYLCRSPFMDKKEFEATYHECYDDYVSEVDYFKSH